MEDQRLFFSIPKHLNKGKRLLGFPRDEFLPALVIFVLGFVSKHYAIGFVLGLVWFQGLRYLKVQYGNNIIALSLYWWGSASFSQNFFRHTPAAQRRYWLS
ncbi:type IV conjugative transfer system protein TraL [Vibrio mimicus]